MAIGKLAFPWLREGSRGSEFHLGRGESVVIPIHSSLAAAGCSRETDNLEMRAAGCSRVTEPQLPLQTSHFSLSEGCQNAVVSKFQVT